MVKNLKNNIMEESQETTAVVVEENTTDQNSDLLKRLSSATETKTPGTQQTKKTTNSFWDASDDDFENTETEKTAEDKGKTEETEKGKTTEPKTENKGEQKITEKVKMGSAKTAVGMIDLTLKGLITPIHNYKFKKKVEKNFNEAQIALIDDKLQDAEEKELDAKELRLKKRFDSIMKKYEKKMAAVPMNEVEKKDMTDAFYNYFDFTQTALSPNWYLAMAITDTVGKRAIDALAD